MIGFGQDDKLIFSSGDTIIGKVIEVGVNDITYQHKGETTNNVIKKRELAKVIYSSGRIETFKGLGILEAKIEKEENDKLYLQQKEERKKIRMQKKVDFKKLLIQKRVDFKKSLELGALFGASFNNNTNTIGAIGGREPDDIEEINKIKELNLSVSLAKARDSFVLMCYLGLRFSDYLKINQNSISNDYLDITMHKTSESVSIPIHPYALEIIKRYNYILPKISNSKLNKMIKKVCKYAEIDNEVTDKGEIKKKYKLVTCHTARRSFATNGYLSDVPVRDLMMITGHKKESTFLNYVQVKREVKLSRILEIYPAKLSRVG